jgi:hypothetical protein
VDGASSYRFLCRAGHAPLPAARMNNTSASENLAQYLTCSEYQHT